MKSLFPFNRLTLPAIAAAAFCHGSPAWAVNISDGNGHVDVLPFQSDGGIVTGHYDFDAEQVIEDTRLFVREIELVFSSLYGTQNPGFTTFVDPNNNAAYTLLPSEDLTFSVPTIEGSDAVARNILYWDGEGVPDFGAVAAGDFFRISKTGSSTDLDGSGTPVNGFTIDSSNPAGEIHDHVSFSARGAGGTQPEDGFYLFAMQLEMNGLDPSEALYMLFNADYERDEQDQILYNGDRPIVDKTAEQLATNWVLDNLLAEALPADLDGDGDVDDADYGLFFAAFSGPGVGPPSNPAADLDSDNDVDDADFGLAFAAFTGPGGASAVVPEPGSLVAWLFGAGLIAARRRRGASIR